MFAPVRDDEGRLLHAAISFVTAHKLEALRERASEFRAASSFDSAILFVAGDLLHEVRKIVQRDSWLRAFSRMASSLASLEVARLK